ncbi:hypothetical protein TNCV_1240031 [Trichonephila clavipes]|nr:hypothetical protein TNCV_1240031 [Trichonephila clavipes]
MQKAGIGKSWLWRIAQNRFRNSLFGFCEWNTRKRWRDGQGIHGAFGPDSLGVFLGVLCANREEGGGHQERLW